MNLLFYCFSLAYLPHVNASVFEFRSMILQKKKKKKKKKGRSLLYAIIILTSKFFLDKKVNIPPYLSFGQSLTKLYNTVDSWVGRNVSVRTLNFIVRDRPLFSWSGGMKNFPLHRIFMHLCKHLCRATSSCKQFFPYIFLITF